MEILTDHSRIRGVFDYLLDQDLAVSPEQVGFANAYLDETFQTKLNGLDLPDSDREPYLQSFDRATSLERRSPTKLALEDLNDARGLLNNLLVEVAEANSIDLHPLSQALARQQDRLTFLNQHAVRELTIPKPLAAVALVTLLAATGILEHAFTSSMVNVPHKQTVTEQSDSRDIKDVTHQAGHVVLSLQRPFTARFRWVYVENISPVRNENIAYGKGYKDEDGYLSNECVLDSGGTLSFNGDEVSDKKTRVLIKYTNHEGDLAGTQCPDGVLFYEPFGDFLAGK